MCLKHIIFICIVLQFLDDFYLTQGYTFPRLDFYHNGTHIHPSPAEWIPKCKAHVDHDRSFENIKVPKNDLGVVESCSRPDSEYDYTTSIIGCYARQKGYLHFRDYFAIDETNKFYNATTDNFYNYRWALMRSRYFHTAKWIVGMDSDHATVNFNANLLDYLELDDSNEPADIVLHVR